MEHLLKELGSASAQTIGLAVAVGILLATFVLLPVQDRRLLRQPMIYLAVHVVARGVDLIIHDGSALSRIVSLISLTALLASIGRAGVVLVFEVVLHRRLATPIPKIIRDIVQGLVYVVILLAILRAVGFEPGQILTTSAVLTAVIGLSLQDTLGNLVAGLAVQLQRPFDVGDWIQFDGENKNIGRVVEINWRATKIITLDEIEVVVPNGMLAKSALKNYTKPTVVVRRSVYVTVGYDVAPRRVAKTILQAIADSPGLVRDPAPSVVTNDMKDSGIEYWVRYFIDQFGRRDSVDGTVRDRIWYSFQRAGIPFAFPQRVVQMNQISDESRAIDVERRTSKKERALEKVDFLGIISPAQRRELAHHATTRLFSTGELIVKQGDETSEFFIILKGMVTVTLEGDRSSTEVTRLSAGEFFGEMALVTGERRKATVKASAECELLVIDHEAFQPILQENPTVAEQLSEVLADRQLKLDEHAEALSSGDRASVKLETSNQLLGKIKKFFAITR